MSKSLTEMAAEIIAARVKHEAMTSQQIAECLNETFEALQKLKEKENIIPESAVQEPTETLEQPAQAKTEPEETTVQESLEEPKQPPLEPEPDESPVQDPIEESEKPKKVTIAGTILNLIKSNPKGVDTKYIMEETGLNKTQVWATISNAKKKGKIKITKRGIYVSV